LHAIVAIKLNTTLCQAVLPEGNNEEQAALANISTTLQDWHVSEAGEPFMLLAMANKAVLQLCCMVLPTAVVICHWIL
jgi:hypothetical protein